MRELIITNGDSAATLLRKAGLGTDIVPWRDVLHDGPVPLTDDLTALSAHRAAFLAASSWADSQMVADDFAARDAQLIDCEAYDEVALWFEHDLYDQLQLLQILDWFAGHPPAQGRLFLVQADDFLGIQEPSTLERFATRRAPVTDRQRDLARTAWTAFRQTTPEAWAALRTHELALLPHLPRCC